MKWLKLIEGSEGPLWKDKNRIRGTSDEGISNPGLVQYPFYNHTSAPGYMGIHSFCERDHYDPFRTELALRLAPEL